MTIGNNTNNDDSAASARKTVGGDVAQRSEPVSMDQQYRSAPAATDLAEKSKPVKQKRESTRKRIQKLVLESGKNYPSYLKLIYTGESDFSGSDDEAVDRQKKAQRPSDMPGLNGEFQPGLPCTDTMNNSRPLDPLPPTCDIPLKGNGEDNECGMMLDVSSRASPSTPGEKMDSQKPSPCTPGDRQRAGKNDAFYETTDITSPEYDNAVNQNNLSVDPEERARQEEEWKTELIKLEDEITTLRQVLSAKVKQSSDLKHKLGITAMAEFKQDIKQGFQNIKDSGAYQKTSAAMKTVGHKTGTAFTSFGSYTSKKLGDFRNSNAFKSFEEKVGGAYTNVKGNQQTRVSGSKSENNFDEVLRETADAESKESTATSQSAATTPVGEKVPL